MTTNEKVTVAIAIIVAIPGVFATVVGLANRGKLDVIHVLVNSNLTEIKNQLRDALSSKESDVAEIQRLRDNAATQHNAADHPEITKGG